MENLYIMIKKWITVGVYMIFLNYFFYYSGPESLMHCNLEIFLPPSFFLLCCF